MDPRAWAFGSPAAGLVDEWYGTASPMTNAEPGKDTRCQRVWLPNDALIIDPSIRRFGKTTEVRDL